MKRREPKLPRGPKPARVNPDAARLRGMLDEAQVEFAERIARMVLARLRAEAPQLFTAPAPTPSA
jgi:hypothetical protein